MSDLLQSPFFNGLLGGALIGLSAVLLMATLGRIAGISGILGAALTGPAAERPGRWLFIAGMIVAPLLLHAIGMNVEFVDRRSPAALIIVAGLLVGYGTRLGNGCTSGHGVCGLARLSPRSLAATLMFLVTAMGTVYLARHVFGDQG